MKKLSVLLLMLALSLLLGMTALGAADYGKLYDATDLLDVDTAASFGDDLAALSKKYNVDLRIDVVRDLEDCSIEEYAAIFYEEFLYGADNGDGILLMVYLTEDEDGLAFQDYTIHADGENAALLRRFESFAAPLLDEVLNAQAWNGDLSADDAAFRSFRDTYYVCADSFLSNMAGTSEPQTDTGTVSPKDGSSFVIDDAGLLTEKEWDLLEKMAGSLRARYGCAVYLITVDDFTPYGFNVTEAGRYIHQQLGLEPDALLLLLSMRERDYVVDDFGTRGEYLITDYGVSTLEDAMLDNFGDNDWFGGFHGFLEQASVLLEYEAENGTPFNKDADRGTFIERAGSGYSTGALFSLVIAWITCGIFKSKMKSAVIATSAEEYVSEEGILLHVREDQYTHTTKTSRRIERESSSSGGSDGDSSSSGKF